MGGTGSGRKPRTRRTTAKKPENLDDNAGGNPLADSFFPDVQGDAYVILRRRDPTDNAMVFHGRLTLEQANEETVASLFGGGFYTAQLRVRSENGSWQYGAQKTFRVSGPYRAPTGPLPGAKRDTEPEGDDKPEVGTGAVEQLRDTDARSVLETAVVSQLIDMMRVSKEVLARPPMDWAGILAALTPILVPLLARKQEPQPSVADIADQVARAVQQAMAQVAAPSQPSSVIAQVVDAVRMLREAGHDLESGGSTGDPLMDAIPKLAEIFANAQKAGVQPPTPPAAPSVAVVPAGEVWQRVLQQQGNTLVRFAAMRASPEWAAETAVTLMPADIREPMTDFLSQENAADQVIGVVPRMGNYRRWLDAFIEEARRLLAPDDDDVLPGDIVEGDGDDDSTD